MPDTLLGGIVINEILANPVIPGGGGGFDTDGNGTINARDEFLELYNSSAAPINVSGVQLWDTNSNLWFTFPPGTTLQPGARAMVIAAVQAGGSLPTGGPDDLFFNAARGVAVLNNSGDNVVVYDPASNTYIQAHYGTAPLIDPTAAGGFTGFPTSATRIGEGEFVGTAPAGSSIQRAPDGGSRFVTGTPTPGLGNICFADGTRLLTRHGEIPIESLKAGDMLVTADHGLRRVSWVFRKTWSRQDQQADPARRAVSIAENALGPGMPHKRLLLSQQHRLLVSGPIVARMFGQAEVLVPAKALLRLEGVTLAPPRRSITYYHVLLEGHQVLFANGLPAESLHLGPMARATLPAEALAEVEALLERPIEQLGLSTVRDCAGLRRSHTLLRRHRANSRPLDMPRPAATRRRH